MHKSKASPAKEEGTGCTEMLQGRLRACCYLFMHRHIFPAVLIMAALAAGVLIGAYWTTLRCYVVRVGIGESMLKFAPVAGPTLGIIVFLWQISRARYNQRIDLILKLAERFEKSELRAARAKAARSLLPNRKADNGAIGELLSFFEEVGFLLQRRAIDIDGMRSIIGVYPSVH